MAHSVVDVRICIDKYSLVKLRSALVSGVTDRGGDYLDLDPIPEGRKRHMDPDPTEAHGTGNSEIGAYVGSNICFFIYI